MKYTLDMIEKIKDNFGNVNLAYTDVDSLPDGLSVGGWLDLRGTQIKELPENLSVCGSLDLRGTQIKELPENLSVCGSLDLHETQIKELPENLSVGGSLYLSGTQIEKLPVNLSVGGWLYFRGTQIKNKEMKKVHHLKDGDYVKGKYIFADGILTLVKSDKKIGKYTYYVGKIKNKNVIYDGEYYAQCRSFKDGVTDLLYKHAKDRGASQYDNLSLDSTVTKDEAITMYRVITGACQAGTEQFVDSLGKLKDSYTIKEVIEITKGQYNSSVFESFFMKER